MTNFIVKTITIFLATLAVFNISNAQELPNYSIFITSGITENKPDSFLNGKMQKMISESSESSILVCGNFSKHSNISDLMNLKLNNSVKLLLAPGKLEWENGKYAGKENLINLNSKLTDSLKSDFFIPQPACPTPLEINLTENIVLILIDTYWWLYKYDRRLKKCDIENEDEVFVLIEDIIKRNYPQKHIIIAGYNSVINYGNSGGHFSKSQWIFQTPYTFLRKLPGTRNDISHIDFKKYRTNMIKIAEKYPNLIYVSGNENNLQYFTLAQSHQIISGSWSKTSFVDIKKSNFAAKENGYAVLNFYSSGKCKLSFYNASEMLFSEILYTKNNNKQQSDFVTTTHSNNISASASNRYNIKPSAYKFFGENYRNVWQTQVKVPVFDISQQNNGLKVLKRGGGMQTFSLRLADKDGNEYVLRSVDKTVEKALPETFQNTVAADIVQDQISASNPYAAPVVAFLAEKSGILHTNPKIVYIPLDPNFGAYMTDVAQKLFIFEEHISANRTDSVTWANACKVISTEKLVHKLINETDIEIDKEAVLKARLFDIVINDWDRHDDQWKWAGFEQNGFTVYKPVPRDRDQAFFVNEGIIPYTASRKWILPKIQGFKENTQNVEGLAFNARYFDRTFLNSLSLDDWKNQTKLLQSLLSPEVIDSSVSVFPPEIISLIGNETSRILKSRVNNLEIMAIKLYNSLAREVSVIGTNTEDIFEIKSVSDTSILLNVITLNTNTGEKKLIYNRKFFSEETKYLNLYGLDDNDIFKIDKNISKKIKIYVLPGEGNDKILLDNNLKQNNIKIYDTKNTQISPEQKSLLNFNFNKFEAEYDRKHFKYDVVFPGIFSGYNPDDGVFFGGGPLFFKYSRYSQSKIAFSANYAFSTNAYNLKFTFEKYLPLNNLKIKYNANYSSPWYAGKFFGFGNYSVFDNSAFDISYYRYRAAQLFSQIEFVNSPLENKNHKFGYGFFVKYFDAEPTPDRFISTMESNLSAYDLSAKLYSGIIFSYELNTFNNYFKAENNSISSPVFPQKGINLKFISTYFAGMNKVSDNFLKLQVNFESYSSFSQRSRIVFVFKAGAERNFGNYFFAEAAKIGSNHNLRGYRKDRYYGDASAYTNFEIRLRLKQFSSYLLKGTAGLFFFDDSAVLQYGTEIFDKLNNGYGFGFWVSPFDTSILNFYYSFGIDENLLGFSFNYKF